MRQNNVHIWPQEFQGVLHGPNVADTVIQKTQESQGALKENECVHDIFAFGPLDTQALVARSFAIPRPRV